MKLTVITIGENNFSDKDRDLIAKLIDNETHKAAGRQAKFKSICICKVYFV